jgi:hypothetical protein
VVELLPWVVRTPGEYKFTTDRRKLLSVREPLNTGVKRQREDERVTVQVLERVCTAGRIVNYIAGAEATAFILFDTPLQK